MEDQLKLENTESIKVSRKRLAKAERRLNKLDRLFIRIYEDNVSGHISDERFTLMSKTYEDEQTELKKQIQYQDQLRLHWIHPVGQAHGTGFQVMHIELLSTVTS